MTSPDSSTWATRNLRMFTGAGQRQNFSRLASIFPARVVCRADVPCALPYSRAVEPPPQFEFRGRMRGTQPFLTDVDTVSLIVLQHGKVVHEWMTDARHATLQWPSWSIAKSIVSCLIGIAVDQGAIASIHEPVTRYAPMLAGSAYDGVSIEHVLQMCSGARWSANYADPSSDAQRSARAQESRAAASGVAMDPLGMEDDAFFLVDATGTEWAADGVQATLRDFAKFGLLYLNDGVAHETRVVSSAGVRASTRAQAPHLEPGEKTQSSGNLGYGYLWWLAPDADGAFCAIGVYNQYVYVNQKRGVVIAKASANRRYAQSYDEAGYRDEEHLALFAAIAQAV